ncbi:MAG: hypothetical protein E7157_00900 [Lactobacillales bacterium]|nr:hypothetical protein [Lactobacillales bacterium]
MEELKEMLLDRYTDFWYDIYNIEKEELKRLKKYIDYTEKELRHFNSLSYDYDSIASLFMNKHLDYMQEAYTSLLLKNYNAFSCVMRIIIENYVSFTLIKKYKKKEIHKDWYLWSFNKLVNIVDTEPYHTKVKKGYEKICGLLNVSSDYINNKQSYGWLNRVVKLKNYSFKNACEIVDKEIYKDFSYLSGYIHNTDFYAKTNWIDMTTLTKFIFILYSYSEKMIKTYNHYIIRRKEYNELTIFLLESLNNCCEYKEIEV